MAKGVIYTRPIVNEHNLIKIDCFELGQETKEQTDDMQVAYAAMEVDNVRETYTALTSLFFTHSISANDHVYGGLDIDNVVTVLKALKGKSYKQKSTSSGRQKYILKDGVYEMTAVTKNGSGEVPGEMIVENGKYVVLKGAKCAIISNSFEKYNKKLAEKVNEARKKYLNKGTMKLNSDVDCGNDIDFATSLITGSGQDSYNKWTDENGNRAKNTRITVSHS